MLACHMRHHESHQSTCIYLCGSCTILCHCSLCRPHYQSRRWGQALKGTLSDYSLARGTRCRKSNPTAWTHPRGSHRHSLPARRVSSGGGTGPHHYSRSSICCVGRHGRRKVRSTRTLLSLDHRHPCCCTLPKDEHHCSPQATRSPKLRRKGKHAENNRCPSTRGRRLGPRSRRICRPYICHDLSTDSRTHQAGGSGACRMFLARTS